jgi:uncharacterized protein
MGVLRLILLAAIVWIVWRLIARALRVAKAAGPRSSDHDYLPLARCSVCGAHVPQPQAGAAAICERCRSH